MSSMAALFPSFASLTHAPLATYYLLPTTYYLPPTTYYLLPTTYYLLPTTYCLLLPTTTYRCEHQLNSTYLCFVMKMVRITAENSLKIVILTLHQGGCFLLNHAFLCIMVCAMKTANTTLQSEQHGNKWGITILMKMVCSWLKINIGNMQQTIILMKIGCLLLNYLFFCEPTPDKSELVGTIQLAPTPILLPTTN